MSNVVSLPKSGDDDRADEEFNRLYDTYLKAKAKFESPVGSDQSLARASDDLTDIVWSLVKTRAVTKHHVGMKLEVLRAMLQGGDGSWVDSRERMLLESIRIDVGEA